MSANPAASTPGLTLETEKGSTENVIRCRGKITAATGELLQTQVRALAPEKKRIVLDLAGTSYVDSSGLGTLVGLYVSCRKVGSQLKLANLTPRLKELFAMTNLAPIFEGHDDMPGRAPG